MKNINQHTISVFKLITFCVLIALGLIRFFIENDNFIISVNVLSFVVSLAFLYTETLKKITEKTISEIDKVYLLESVTIKFLQISLPLAVICAAFLVFSKFSVALSETLSVFSVAIAIGAENLSKIFINILKWIQDKDLKNFYDSLKKNKGA